MIGFGYPANIPQRDFEKVRALHFLDISETDGSAQIRCRGASRIAVVRSDMCLKSTFNNEMETEGYLQVAIFPKKLKENYHFSSEICFVEMICQYEKNKLLW